MHLKLTSFLQRLNIACTISWKFNNQCFQGVFNSSGMSWLCSSPHACILSLAKRLPDGLLSSRSTLTTAWTATRVLLHTKTFTVSIFQHSTLHLVMRKCESASLFRVLLWVQLSCTAYIAKFGCASLVDGRSSPTVGVDDGRIRGDEPACPGSRVGLRDSLTQPRNSTLPCVDVQ